MRKTRFSSIAALSALFLIVGVMAAAPAFAATDCQIADSDFETMNLNVDEGAAISIVRAVSTDEAEDDKILVSTTGDSDLCSDEEFYTVFDIDTINITGGGAATIDLAGGDFAPGFNTETGTDEIEFYVASTIELTIHGTAGVDTWSFGQSATSTGPKGLGLNSDSDPDILASPTTSLAASVTADGKAGNDKFEQISAAPEVLIGGAGTDIVDYSTRTTPLAITVGNNAADDGETANTGEKDNVAADIERVIGGSGNDTISVPTASTTNYRLEGGAGTDVLTGGAGRDLLFGDAGTDTLNGGAARDTLNGGADADIENGDEGSDVFDQERVSNGGDTLNGGTDAGENPKDVDVVKYNLRSGDLNVTVGAAGNGDGEANEGDNINATVERVNGGTGDDNMTAASNGTKLYGGAGADDLFGGDGKDRLVAGGGDDTAEGGADNDYLSGGSDDDDLTGGAGNDNLAGGSGNDDLNGEAGNDRVSGGSNADRLWGDGPGVTPQVKDTVVGGSDSDGKDLCERDLKDVRSGCEGRASNGDAPTS